jgi:PAS domain S-box-containing protein
MSDSSLNNIPKPWGTDQIFKDMVNNSPVAIYTCDKDGYITFYNNAAVELWGRAPVIGKDLWCGSWKIYYPTGEPMDLDSCPMALTLKGSEFFGGTEITIERPDNTFKNLLVFPRALYDSNGQVNGAHNTLVDITVQKQGEEKQYMLSAIVASSDDAIISKSLAGIITSWNNGAERIFGYTEDEIIGKHISVLIPLALQDEENVIIGNIKAGRKIDHFQTTRLHKTGREIPISITVSPVKDNLGRITGASKVARDISERVIAEQQVKQNAQRLAVLNDIGKTISEKLDVQSILQKVTDATTMLTGAAFGAFFYNQVDEKGESFTLFTLSGAPREAFEKFGVPRNTAVFAPTFSGQRIVRVDDIRQDPSYGHNAPHYGMPKGHLPVVSYLSVPVTSSSGQVIGGLFFGHPEPAMFTMEHEVLVDSIASQAAIALDNSKMVEDIKALSAKKDEFIALASHELKTPLTSIKGYLQVLDRTEKDNMGKAFLAKALNQVEKLNSLVTDLLDVSRVEAGKLAMDKTSFSLRDLALEVIDNLNHTHQTHRISCLTAEAVTVFADKQRVEQVLVNLLTNAIKYSPQASQILVSLKTTNNDALVTVKDEGIGLDESQQQQIFTRFYRAEGTANVPGLGLGLYLTKEIVDRHGGSIGVRSEEGKGSEFWFTLPLA